MPSHGALKAVATAASNPEKEMKREVGKFHHMELSSAANGGVIATHFHAGADGYGMREHPAGPHAFGENEGHLLAAHIEKHLGITMPGRAEGTVAKPAGGEEGKED